jgi:hypothetical protein
LHAPQATVVGVRVVAGLVEDWAAAPAIKRDTAMVLSMMIQKDSTSETIKKKKESEGVIVTRQKDRGHESTWTFVDCVVPDAIEADEPLIQPNWGFSRSGPGPRHCDLV